MEVFETIEDIFLRHLFSCLSIHFEELVRVYQMKFLLILLEPIQHDRLNFNQVFSLE
jgi:hypothetical protein